MEADDGPTLVLAGAGSGKTRVLTGRAFYLIAERRVNPDAIAVVTFTNKAARELRERLSHLLGDSGTLPWAGTFHGFCVRLLRHYGSRFGVTRDFTIYDEDDSLKTVSAILREMGIARESIKPQQVRSWISVKKNGGRVDHRSLIGKVASEVYDEYVKRVAGAGAFDFDDLLLKPLELMREHEELRVILQHKYDHLLIDEFQDTNRVQFELAQTLALPQNNLYAVGDDDQSIYSWRGADYKNILNFCHELKGAALFRLEQNYRSTQHILDVANDVIAAAKHRDDKKLWTSRHGGEKVTLRSFTRPADEANEIIGELDHLARKHNFRYSDCAILMRTNSISRYFEEVLVQHRIPYIVVGGVRFYERKEVKDLIAVLRVLANPSDEQAWQRALREVAPGVGDTTIERVFQAARISERQFTSLLDKVWIDEILTGAPRTRLVDFVASLNKLRSRLGEIALGEFVQLVVDESGVATPYSISEEKEDKERLDNLKQFCAGAWEREQKTPGITLAEFLSEVALVADVDGYDERADRVTLMTIHAAKGLEFPVIFLAGIEENILPHARSQATQDDIEEERRLFYVGITRAKDRLFLSYAETRPLNGRLEFQIPSRFLSDISPSKLRGYSIPTRVSSARQLDDDSGSEQEAVFDRVAVEPKARKVSVLSSEPVIGYRIGDVVEHPEFGVGTVTAKSGDLHDLKVRVAFSGFGSKLLAVKYAKLKKLS